MHINMKYYVVSIGAIFIALGIGMLVGFNLNYDQELSKQQATIIEDLDKKFENLKTKNDELEKALDSSEKNNTQLVEYINSNYEKIIKDELQDKNIGVITTSNDYDYSEQVQKTIKDATGNIGASSNCSTHDHIKPRISSPWLSRRNLSLMHVTLKQNFTLTAERRMG